ncbi:hypothetical protein Bbelb_393010 [Branchiostoma belcheri]|nr:hypothetical protein Bbelb_393010 [Branchiostoma belcheri]
MYAQNRRNVRSPGGVYAQTAAVRSVPISEECTLKTGGTSAHLEECTLKPPPLQGRANSPTVSDTPRRITRWPVRLLLAGRVRTGLAPGPGPGTDSHFQGCLPLFWRTLATNSVPDYFVPAVLDKYVVRRTCGKELYVHAFTVHAFTVHAFTVHAFTIHAFTAHAFTAHAFTVHAFTIHAFTAHAFTAHAFTVHAFTVHAFTKEYVFSWQPIFLVGLSAQCRAKIIETDPVKMPRLHAFTVHAFTVHAFTVHAFTIHAFTAHAFTAHAFTVHAFTIHAFTAHAFTAHAFTVHAFTVHAFTKEYVFSWQPIFLVGLSAQCRAKIIETDPVKMPRRALMCRAGGSAPEERFRHDSKLNTANRQMICPSPLPMKLRSPNQPGDVGDNRQSSFVAMVTRSGNHRNRRRFPCEWRSHNTKLEDPRFVVLDPTRSLTHPLRGSDVTAGSPQTGGRQILCWRVRGFRVVCCRAASHTPSGACRDVRANVPLTAGCPRGDVGTNQGQRTPPTFTAIHLLNCAAQKHGFGRRKPYRCRPHHLAHTADKDQPLGVRVRDVTTARLKPMLARAGSMRPRLTRKRLRRAGDARNWGLKDSHMNGAALLKAKWGPKTGFSQPFLVSILLVLPKRVCF